VARMERTRAGRMETETALGHAGDRQYRSNYRVQSGNAPAPTTVPDSIPFHPGYGVTVLKF